MNLLLMLIASEERICELLLDTLPVEKVKEIESITSRAHAALSARFTKRVCHIQRTEGWPPCPLHSHHRRQIKLILKNRPKLKELRETMWDWGDAAKICRKILKRRLGEW